MAKKIIWTDNASKDFESVVSWLNYKREVLIANNFIDEVRRKVSLLALHQGWAGKQKNTVPYAGQLLPNIIY